LSKLETSSVLIRSGSG